MSSVESVAQRDAGGEIVITPLPAALGAKVSCGDLTKVDAKGREQLRQAYLDHLILIFNGQHLSDDGQVSITDIFGELGDGVYGTEGRHKVITVSNQPGGALGSGDLRWHSDHSFEERPISASLLHALVVPPEGGDTYWTNMYLAYATMPPALLERVRNLTIKNDISTNSAGQRVERVPETTDVRLSLGPSHPIIRTHPETGLNALYLGRRPFAYVNGLSIEDSENLLNELWAHAENPEFAYGHHWTAGDLVVWDNRAVMHRRDAFDENQTRVMHRTQCRGDLPVYLPEADARGFHPRAGDWISRLQRA